MFENLTQSCQNLLLEAQNSAKSFNNSLIEPLHLLYALSLAQDGSAGDLMSDLKLNTSVFKSDVKNAIENLPKVSSTGDIYFSKDTLALYELAKVEAKNLKDKFISPEHILLALAEFVQNAQNGVNAEVERIFKNIQLQKTEF